MPNKLIDITGQVFGRLTAVYFIPNKNGIKNGWFCECICGNNKVIVSSDLRAGKTTSCGCFHKEVVSKQFSTHGQSGHPLHTVWTGMKARCYNVKDEFYHHYGGRGIIVCQEWKNDFGIFFQWAIENGWQKGLEIDRENNDLGYEPGNCRFVTGRVNVYNRSNTLKVIYKGEEMTLLDLETLSAIPSNRLYQRIHVYGWTAERAAMQPLRNSAKRNSSRNNIVVDNYEESAMPQMAL